MAGIEGGMARLYDVFVDWEARLGREMPGILRRLERAKAKRVLDVGCGTGRHVQALREKGYDAVGADASADMLAHAGGPPECFHQWRMGDAPPAALARAAPFDAVLCLGNTWPQLTEEADVRAALQALRKLLKRGGLLLMGLKALAVRRDAKDPYLPLLRREHEGLPHYFVRFVEFDAGDTCQFHMLVARGDAATEEPDAALHRVSRVRVWSPAELQRRFSETGFFNVRVSARLDDPDALPTTEDVYLHAFAP